MASASDFEVVSEPKASDFEEVTPKASEFEVVSEPSGGIPALEVPEWFTKLSPAEQQQYGQDFAPEPLGKTLNRTGRVVSGALADAGTMTLEDLKKGEFSNIAAALSDEKLPVADLMEAKSTPGAVSFPYKVTSGLVESTPKLAAVVGAEALGVPAPVAAGYVFGQTETGFSPKDAAVAAALPFVGKYSGNIVGAIAKKFGVSSIDALNIWKGIGATGGAAAYAATIDESQIANLPPEQRNQARIDMIAGLIGQSALGPMGMEKEHSPFELVEKPAGNLDEQAIRDLSIRDKPAEVVNPIKPEEFELVQSIADKGAPATAKAVEQVLTHDFEEVKPAEAQPENSPLAKPAESGNNPETSPEIYVEDMARDGKPIPSALVDDNGLSKQLGEEYGYVKEGDHYVLGNDTPDNQFEPVPNEQQKSDSEAPQEKPAISEGPGAASPTDFPVESELKQLTESISKGVKSDSPLPKQISVIERASDAMADAKDTFKTSLARLKAVGDAVYQKFTQRPQWTDEKAAVGKWTYANQKADREAMQFRKEIEKAIPDKARREAMTNWIQANGDEALLKSRADASKGSIKRGYESAMKLTEYEKTVARNVSQYLDAQLQRGIDADILSNGIENYVNQVWKRENTITRAIRSDFQSSKLQPNFRFAKERIFSSYFEGEQAGYAPSNKDLGALIAFYDQAFNKTLSARAFLRDLHEGNASDGRPLVEVAGSGDTIEGKKGSTILIKPRTQKQEVWDYREIDHPAMRGWKWVGSDTNGSPIMMQGQLLVHPEAYVKLRNRLQSSGWRTNPIGKAILDTQSMVKQTMLSISGFHQAQETIHALGHRVNPTNLDKIDLDDPTQKALVTHGLQVADYHAAEMFGEGLSSGALTNKIPWVGNKILKPYTEWLFQEYIPRLKITMAREALERNTTTYGAKLNRDQILELTAQQANAAFGELNYKFMGRNPTLQDTFRALLLAPDFLEARAKFVGQALKPHGREQLLALGILAATQFISARLMNKALDDDFHWDKPFSYVYKGREYKLRTVPGDIAHLLTDSRSFFYNRLSPLLGRGAVETITGRDDRGVKRDALEQVKDLAKMAVPISLKQRDDTKLWEAFLNSFGLQEKKFSAVTEISEQARKFKSANSKPTPYEEVYDAEKDAYRPLRVALDNKNLAAAQKAYDDLKKTVPPNTIAQSIHRYYTKPFAGSIQNEANFTHQLDAHGKETYQKAGQERLQNLKFFGTVRK